MLGPIHDPPTDLEPLLGDPRDAWAVAGVTLPLAPPLAGMESSGEMHDQEHSLEVVVAALVREGFRGRLLPVLMHGGRSLGLLGGALEVIAEWLCERPHRVVVATTDLDHYHEPAAARRAHMAFEAVLSRGDPDELLVGLEGGAFRPCGAGPTWLAMALGRRFGWSPRVLGYGWSGAEPAEQVGFLAVAFEEE